MPEFHFSPSRLRLCRERAGLRLEAVALGVERTSDTVKAYERGIATPPGNVIGRLATVLNVTPSDLFEIVEVAA